MAAAAKHKNQALIAYFFNYGLHPFYENKRNKICCFDSWGDANAKDFCQNKSLSLIGAVVISGSWTCLE